MYILCLAFVSIVWALSASAETEAFEKGRNDWHRVLIWFDRSITAPFEAGADYWTANRNVSGYDTCEIAAGKNATQDPERTMVASGCTGAKALFGPIDAQRNSDPSHRAGFNAAAKGAPLERHFASYFRAIASEGEPEGFIFTADGAINPRDETESVRLLEKLPIAQLKTRFSRYKVDVMVGEDCAICANISKGEVSIFVDYDGNGITVTAISSNDKKSTDAIGNAVGTSLRDAIGARTADCDAGYRTTCRSPRLIGLYYVVEESDGCPLVVKEHQPTEIPACAQVKGFQILEAH
jgi:hypothetical protein